jgi:hypothetical protein
MKSRTKFIVAAAAAAAVLACAPAAAHGAVSAKVTGDDGNPAELAPGTTLAIRNMDVRVYAHHDMVNNESWQFTVTDPGGVAATSLSPQCWSSIPDDDSHIIWRGNGTYTVRLSIYSGSSCAGAPKSTTTYTYSVNASVSIARSG